MLVSGTSAASCDGFMVFRHEDQKDCSDPGEPDYDEVKAIEPLFDKCVTTGEVSSMITCSEKGVE